MIQAGRRNELGRTRRRPLERLRVQFGGAARVWSLVGVLALAGLGIYFGAVRGLESPSSPVHVPWWALAVFFCLAEVYVVHLHFRRQAHTLSLSEVGIVIGLFCTSPGGLLVGELIGAGVALIAVRRQRPLKIAFNLAQFGFTSCVGLVIFHAVTDGGNAFGPLGWGGALLATAAAGLISVALVGVAIFLSDGGSPTRELLRVSFFALIGTLANASLALAIVTFLRLDAAAVWLLLVPTVSCGLAFRAFTAQRLQHEHLEFLYDSMRAVQRAQELDTAVAQLLAAARKMLRAELAEIVIFPTGSSTRALRSTLRGNEETVIGSVELQAGDQLALEAVTAEDKAVVLPRGRQPHRLDGYLAERGLTDGILTRLRGEGGVFGTLLVGDRSGDVGTFTSDDGTLFETFATHAGVLLENDRLEQSLAELTELKEKLRHQAFHDSLTGLPNRALFSERVGAVLQSAADGGPLPTVLFLDLDDFKTINDSLGHAAGDQLLVAVSQRVRGCVRPEDTPARLGGDEFAVLLEHADDAERVAQRLVEALQTPFELRGREVSVHASVGIATCRDATETTDELLRNADVAMYSAKDSGKRRYAMYRPEMHRRVRNRHELAAALERAVERDEIKVHYQPIVSLADRRITALEALARWEHPTRGLLQPAEFIPLAEELGLMGPIGRVVLEQACRQAKDWQMRYPSHADVAVSVNLSPSELQDALTGDVATVLADTGLAADRLILEMTESGAIADVDAAITALRDVRGLGVRIALDDFGTGHSSLSHLHELPLDMLKIAKPFVDRLHGADTGKTLAGSILRLADALGLDAVAEGIELPGQAHALASLDCRLGQGYYFARPLDDDAVESHLRDLDLGGEPLSELVA